MKQQQQHKVKLLFCAHFLFVLLSWLSPRERDRERIRCWTVFFGRGRSSDFRLAVQHGRRQPTRRQPKTMEIIYDRIQHSFYIFVCIEEIEKEKAPRAEKTEKKQNKTRPCHYITFLSHSSSFSSLYLNIYLKNVFFLSREKFANFKFLVGKKKRREFWIVETEFCPFPHPIRFV